MADATGPGAEIVLETDRHLKWRAFDWLERTLMILCGVCLMGFTASTLTDVITRESGHPLLSCMDGPRLARSFCDVGVAVSSDHVSGLFVRSDEDRWPRWGYANQVPSIAAC